MQAPHSRTGTTHLRRRTGKGLISIKVEGVVATRTTSAGVHGRGTDIAVGFATSNLDTVPKHVEPRCIHIAVNRVLIFSAISSPCVAPVTHTFYIRVGRAEALCGFLRQRRSQRCIESGVIVVIIHISAHIGALVPTSLACRTVAIELVVRTRKCVCKSVAQPTVVAVTAQRDLVVRVQSGS